MATHSETRQESGRPEVTNGQTPGGAFRVARGRSRVGFRVRKMGLYYVKGRFAGVEGTIETAPDGSFERGELRIDAKTISTRMPPRDWHLRTRDFLDVKSYPEIRVTAEGVEPGPDGDLAVTALFDIHGERRPGELTGHLHEGPTPVLHLQGVLDRHDFGIRARQPFEMIVGREVHLDVELALEPPA